MNDLLNALAHDRLICLRNYGDRWGILHRNEQGKEAEICDKSFDRLLKTWQALLEAWGELE